MDPKLITLIALIETGSFTCAANRLHLTQPAVSQHIQKLERLYNIKIIASRGKTLVFTPEATVLYEYAVLQKHQLEQLEMKLMRHETKLKIGMTLSIAETYMPSGLRRGIIDSEENIEVVVANTKILLESIKEGTMTCALIEGMFNDPDISQHSFQHADFVALVRNHHPLTNSTVTLNACLKYPLLVRENGSGTRNILETWLSEQNCSIHHFSRVIEVGSFTPLTQMLLDCDAISFMYRDVAESYIRSQSLDCLELEGFPIKRNLYFATLKNSMHANDIKRVLQWINTTN